MQITSPENSFPSRQNEFLRSLAFVFIQNQIFGKAADIYEFLYELFPEDVSLGILLSYALLRADKASSALDVLKTIRSQDDSDPFVWLLRAQAYSKLSLAAESARAIRMFVQRKKTDEGRNRIPWS